MLLCVALVRQPWRALLGSAPGAAGSALPNAWQHGSGMQERTAPGPAAGTRALHASAAALADRKLTRLRRMKRKNQIKPGGALHMLDIQLSIKRAKSAAELAQAVAEHGRDMKPQQLVQALQQVPRAVHLPLSGEDALLAHQALDALLKRFVRQLAHFEAHEVAQALHACRQLGYQPVVLADALAPHWEREGAATLLEAQLADVAWMASSLAALSCEQPQLWQALLTSAVPRLRGAPPQQLASLAEALARARCAGSREALQALAVHAAESLSQCSGSELAMYMWSFVTAGVRYPRLYDGVALAAAGKLEVLSSWSLAYLTWGFAQLNKQAAAAAAAAAGEQAAGEHQQQRGRYASLLAALLQVAAGKVLPAAAGSRRSRSAAATTPLAPLAMVLAEPEPPMEAQAVVMVAEAAAGVPWVSSATGLADALRRAAEAGPPGRFTAQQLAQLRAAALRITAQQRDGGDATGTPQPAQHAAAAQWLSATSSPQ